MIWKVWWSNLRVQVCWDCRIPNKSICYLQIFYHSSWSHWIKWQDCKPSKRRFLTKQPKEGNFIWDVFGTLFIKNKYDSLSAWTPAYFVSCCCVNLISESESGCVWEVIWVSWKFSEINSWISQDKIRKYVSDGRILCIVGDMQKVAKF